MKISIFTYREVDIELTLNNGFLAYSFELQGPHGLKVNVGKRPKTLDIMNATTQLIINAIETINKIKDDN